MGTTLIIAGILAMAIGIYKEDVSNPSRLWLYTTLLGFVTICVGIILGFLRGEF